MLVNQKGSTAIITIIIISVVSLAMCFSIYILNWGELEMSYYNSQEKQAYALSEGCIEEALFRLKLDELYNGENLNINGKSCIISVNNSGQDYTIESIGRVGDYTQTIKVDITLVNGSITINSWQKQ